MYIYINNFFNNCNNIFLNNFFQGLKMASRYNAVYFFQHSLMNIPFQDVNSIIHPNAENIPPHLLHYASARYHNSQYWQNIDNVRRDLEHECHNNDYIDSYISYLSMMQTTYSLFTEGNTCFLYIFNNQYFYVSYINY